MTIVWENIYLKEKFLKIFLLQKYIICGKKLPPQPERFTLSADVQTETDTTDYVIKQRHINDYAIVLSDLEKHFSQKFEAVRGVSFTIKRGTYYMSMSSKLTLLI